MFKKETHSSHPAGSTEIAWEGRPAERLHLAGSKSLEGPEHTLNPKSPHLLIHKMEDVFHYLRSPF